MFNFWNLDDNMIQAIFFEEILNNQTEEEDEEDENSDSFNNF